MSAEEHERAGPPKLTARVARRAGLQSLLAPLFAALVQLPLWGFSARPLSILACSLLLGPLAVAHAYALAARRPQVRVAALAGLTFALCLVLFALELNTRLTLLLWQGNSLGAALPKLQNQALTLLHVPGHQTKAGFLDLLLLEGAVAVLCLGCVAHVRRGGPGVLAPIGILLGCALGHYLAQVSSAFLWQGEVGGPWFLTQGFLAELVVSGIVLVCAIPFALAVHFTLFLGERLEQRLWPPEPALEGA